MGKSGEDFEPNPPRHFSWRTFWIYIGFGPPIGATAGLLAYMAPLVEARTRGHFNMSFDGAIAIVFFAYLLGLMIGGPPAAITGLIAACVHHNEEPAWRAVVVGSLLGALTSSSWQLMLTAVRSPPAEMIISVTIIGTFAGAACALIQRNKSPLRRNG